VLIKRVSIVLAQWCPHCVPLSLVYGRRMAGMLEVPVRVLDIDEQLERADSLVRSCGDWCEDYLIPQVFLEYDNGEVKHVFTGFSEAVPVTEARWNSLLSFIGSQQEFERRRPKEGVRRKPLAGFVEKYLSFEGQCRRHCEEPASFTKLSSSEDRLVGAYVCPGGFVSRVIYFGRKADIVGFNHFLEDHVGKDFVNSRDLRVATRYGWELGGDALSEIGNMSPEGVISEVYWTVYPRTDEEKNRGVFLCQDSREKRGCARLFIQGINSKNRLCPKCRRL